MKIYIVISNSGMYPEPMGAFSSEEKARAWLERAHDDWGWTYGEVACATVEEWPVDAD